MCPRWELVTNNVSLPLDIFATPARGYNLLIVTSLRLSTPAPKQEVVYVPEVGVEPTSP